MKILKYKIEKIIDKNMVNNILLFKIFRSSYVKNFALLINKLKKYYLRKYLKYSLI